MTIFSPFSFPFASLVVRSEPPNLHFSLGFFFFTSIFLVFQIIFFLYLAFKLHFYPSILSSSLPLFVILFSSIQFSSSISILLSFLPSFPFLVLFFIFFYSVSMFRFYRFPLLQPSTRLSIFLCMAFLFLFISIHFFKFRFYPFSLSYSLRPPFLPSTLLCPLSLSSI